MNDAAVRAVWEKIDLLIEKVRILEVDLMEMKARSRARLKEEAEARAL